MTLSKRLSRANKITTSENNITVGKLVSVEAITSEITNQATGEITEVEQIEWVWEVATDLGKNTFIHEWSGFSINSEKTYHPGNGKPSTYNKLTTILIQAGLINESDIENTDLEAIDIESLIGKEFEFQLERRKQGRNIKSPRLSTLKLLK